MTYSRDLERYPSEFLELVEKASLGQITLEMEDSKEARRLQGRLYAFLGALAGAARDQENLGNEALMTTAKAAKKVQMRVDGTRLVLRPLDQDDDAKRIRAFFGREPSAGDRTREGKILVPVDASSVPAWLAELAQKRQT